MDSDHIGVIPEASSQVTFVEISLNLLLAIGIDHSIYLFDTKSGENICRINHYPSKVIAASWHPGDSFLISGDSNGDLLKSTLPSSTSLVLSVPSGFISVYFHPSTFFLFILYPTHFLVLNPGYEQLNKVLVAGFKLILDYFSPWKVIVVHSKGVKVVQDWQVPKVSKGKLKGSIDAILNPSALNSIFLLTESKLIEFDTVITK